VHDASKKTTPPQLILSNEFSKINKMQNTVGVCAPEPVVFSAGGLAVPWYGWADQGTMLHSGAATLNWVKLKNRAETVFYWKRSRYVQCMGDVYLSDEEEDEEEREEAKAILWYCCDKETVQYGESTLYR